MNSLARFPKVLFLALLSSSPLAMAGEVEVNLTEKSRIYLAKDATCEAVPNEDGKGLRINYNFENASADWATVQFDIPSLDSINTITVTARGTPATLTAFAIRNEKNQAYTYKFGPVSEDGFQTYELDPHLPMQGGGKKDSVEIDYPITKVFFQIKAKNTAGFLEVSKVVFETN